jgi:hypothetical protein
MLRYKPGFMAALMEAGSAWVQYSNLLTTAQNFALFPPNFQNAQKKGCRTTDSVLGAKESKWKEKIVL